MNSGSSQDDPLQPLKVQSAISHTNSRGRPRQTITFCPQRKSIASKILRDIGSDKKKTFTKSLIQTFTSEDHFTHSTTNVEDAKRSEVGKEETDLYNIYPSSARCKKKMKTKQSRNFKSTQKNDISREISVKFAQNEEQQMTNNEDKTYSCDYPGCSYVTKIMSNLSKHKRIHTNERPYMCDQCTFRTNFVNSLKVHRRTHTCERPYCCELCGHQSNSISNLKKHHLHQHQNESKSIN